MSINLKKVNKKNNNIKYIKTLYNEAFPPIERLPFSVLQIMSNVPGIDFYSVYDDDKLCGLLYLARREKDLLIYYLATDFKVRSKGYGSKILSYIKDFYNTYNIILFLETTHEDCDNLSQRIRRKEFYLRNGFVDTNYYMKDYGGTFDILSTNKTISPKEFKKLVQKFTFWIRKVEIEMHGK